jgi:hypothetical protein
LPVVPAEDKYNVSVEVTATVTALAEKLINVIAAPTENGTLALVGIVYVAAACPIA